MSTDTTTENTTDVRRRRRTHAVGGALALALVTGVVLRSSSAVFTATTGNEDNSLAAGTVTLTDDDGGFTSFAVTNMAPGQSEQRCVEVIYTGSLDPPNPVRVYAASVAETDAGSPTPDAGDLSEFVNITINQGTGAVPDGNDFSCASFTPGADIKPTETLDAFTTAHTDYASGRVTTFNPNNSGDEATFRITLELDSSTANGEQGDALSDIDVFWEVQSS